MAKLSARGRIELGRWQIERETPNSDLTTSERITLALMSDGRLLQKRDVVFKPDTFNPEGRKYSWGWKQYKKIKTGLDLNEILNKWDKLFLDSGYKKV